MSNLNDFPPRAHCLVRWYGFRTFLLLSHITSGSSSSTPLTSESKCNLLLSSANIVLSDLGCKVPLFVQINQNWRKTFSGGLDLLISVVIGRLSQPSISEVYFGF